MSERKLPRVVLASFPQEYRLPAKPSSASSQVMDAHRQTGFLLADDLAAFERLMNAQLRIVAANSKAKGAPAAALYTLWSRTFSHLADACTLMAGGSYASCPPLVRTALDSLAVQQSLIADGFAEYEEWLADAISQDKEHQAIAFDMGRYKAASALVANERLGTLYRLLMDLSVPNFGSSALLSAPESGLQKLSPAFADNAFHLGWAELVTGWLVLLANEQLQTVAASRVMTTDDATASEIEACGRAARDALAKRNRCYVELLGGRFVFMNFRRSPAGQPKRISLG